MLFLIYYNNCMALGTSRAGRPYVVAVIPFSNERKVRLLEEFYGACESFHYRETMAVSRALGVEPRTVERWKYKETFPRRDIAEDLIEWVKQGKPIRMVSPSESPVGML